MALAVFTPEMDTRNSFPEDCAPNLVTTVVTDGETPGSQAVRDSPRLPKKMDLARDLAGRMNSVSHCLGQFTWAPEEMLSIKDEAPKRPESRGNSDWGYQAQG